MDLEKRRLLIREIGHWRKSRLLPEQYCDFLLNLYLEDPAEKPVPGFGISAHDIRNSNWKIWLLIFAVIGIISFSVLNFTSFPLPMQIGAGLLLLFVCYFIGFMQREKRPTLAYAFVGVASLSLLLLGLYMIRLHHADDNPLTIVFYVMLCSVIWLLTGIMGRMSIYHFCGWIGFALVYGWVLKRYAGVTSWAEIQMGWVPFSALFVWVGWLFHHKNKAVGAVFLITGACLWFAPELFGLSAVEQAGQALQLSLLGKIIVAGIVLFLFRKKWIEWVV